MQALDLQCSTKDGVTGKAKQKQQVTDLIYGS